MNLLYSQSQAFLIYSSFQFEWTHGSHLLLLDSYSNQTDFINQDSIKAATHSAMQKPFKIKYGLKNATSFLQKFKRERYEQTHEIDSMNEKQQTFDNCEIPSSKESPHQAKPKQQTHLKTNKFVKSTISSTDNLEESPVRPKVKYGLSDLVINKHLAEKLNIYEEDLKQLEENRQNFVEAIEEISGKIEGLHDLQDKNQMLQLENFKNKKEILGLIKKYHELKMNMELKRIKIQENFIKKKERIKSLLEVLQSENQYVVEAESWNFYYREILLNTTSFKQSQSEKKQLEEIFAKMDQGLDLKKKEKNKTKVDKSSLLGDLKSFAKNFKMPNQPNMPNEV